MTNRSPDKMHTEDFSQFMSFVDAYMRAVEHDREDHIIIDPYAWPLTHRIAPQLAPRLRKWTESLAQPENYIALRTRYLDDAITQRGSSIRQVVLFRAGLDTRPCRLASLQDCHVFEVDQNIELFEHKVHILEALDAQLIPFQHDIIVADVNAFNWEEKLLTAGFDSNIPTFWALDGVTMYLEKASNVALLKTIDILSAPGSEIWGDVGGQALKEGEIAVFHQVDKLSHEELGVHLFRLGDDDPIHGVFSDLPWELELQAELGKPGTHFGREWEPVLSVRTKEPVPLSFVHAAKQ